MKIRQLACATSSFVHHFVAIGQFKLKGQSGNAQFGWKSAILCSLWPCNLMADLEKTIRRLFYATSSFGDFFAPCDIGIWLMALENSEAPHFCHFQLYASFLSHQSIQTGVRVRKHPIGVKIGDFWSLVILKFDVWPNTKLIEHLFHAISSFLLHLTTIDELKLELQSGCAPIRVKISNFRSTVTLKLDGWPWQ